MTLCSLGPKSQHFSTVGKEILLFSLNRYSANVVDSPHWQAVRIVIPCKNTRSVPCPHVSCSTPAPPPEVRRDAFSLQTHKLCTPCTSHNPSFPLLPMYKMNSHPLHAGKVSAVSTCLSPTPQRHFLPNSEAVEIIVLCNQTRSVLVSSSLHTSLYARSPQLSRNPSSLQHTRSVQYRRVSPPCPARDYTRT